MSKFSDQITALGEVLGVSLQAEQENLCKIRIKDQISVHIEYDEARDRILLVSFIAELPPGKFREECLLTALKANYLDSSLGSFAYVDSKQTLVAQLFLPSVTAAPLLATLLHSFAEKTLSWKLAIQQGTIASLIPKDTKTLPSPMNLS